MVSLVLALVSGAVLSGAFAPLNWWFLLPLAVAIFLYAVTKTRRPFLVSFVFAASFNFLTLKWSGIYVGLVPVLFLVILQSAFYLPLGFISYKRNRYSRIWLVLPVLLLADELRSIFPFGGFGWNRLAFSQADSPYINIARLLGDASLTFLAVSLGIAFYLLWAKAQLLSVALIAIITTLAIFIPTPALNQGSVNVLAIQGNVPELGLDFNSRAEEVFSYHLKQTNAALEQIDAQPDVIVWPENSVDVDPFVNVQVGQKISDLARRSKTPIIVGAVLKTSKGPQNASIMWSSQGEVVSQYLKRSLTPFGEYIPLRSIANRVTPLTKKVIDFLPGNQVVLHKVGESVVAPIICYEIIDDSAVRSITRDSDFILVQTNNATFADSGQSMQQLNISRIRAVENNRWIVSVSTTGVSAIIDNGGNIQDITDQNVGTYISSDVQTSSAISLANKLGDWSSILCIFLAAIIYIGKRRQNA
jgi:apolipoprotein N-acyltransferase